MSEEDVVEAQQNLCSSIPEYCIKDMAAWFKFLAFHNSDLLKSTTVLEVTRRTNV